MARQICYRQIKWRTFMTDITEIDSSLAQTLGRYWWILVVRGIIAIIFGILAFVLLGMTLLTLVFLFGIYVLINGILVLAYALSVLKGYLCFGAMIFIGFISIT